MKPGEEEITYVRFVNAVRVNRTTETYLDTHKSDKLKIGWHPKGIVIDSTGPRVVIPAANIAWVEIK